MTKMKCDRELYDEDSSEETGTEIHRESRHTRTGGGGEEFVGDNFGSLNSCRRYQNKFL